MSEALNRFNGKPSVLRRLPNPQIGSRQVAGMYNWLSDEEMPKRERTNKPQVDH